MSPRRSLAAAAVALVVCGGCAAKPAASPTSSAPPPASASPSAPAPATASSSAPALPSPLPRPWHLVGSDAPAPAVVAVAAPAAGTVFAIEQSCPASTSASAGCTLTVLAGPTAWKARGTISGLEYPRVAFVDARHGWLVGQSCPVRRPCTSRLLLTADGGATWRQAQSAPALAVYENSADELWVGSAAGLLYSANGGKTWTRDTPPATPAALDFLNDSDGWMASTAGRVYRTTDGGRSWTRLGQLPGLIGAPGEVPSFSGTLQFVNSDNGWVRYCDENGDANGGCPTAVLHTADGGQTWKTQFDLRCIGSATLRVFDADRAVLATSGGTACNPPDGMQPDLGYVFATDDGGATWTRVGAGPGILASAAFPAPGDVWALVRARSPDATAVAHSADGGRTWAQALPAPAPIQAVTLLPGGRDGFGIGSPLNPGQVLATTDGGATWRAVGSPAVRASTVVFADGRSGWALGSGSLYATSDGGASWTRVALPAVTAIAAGQPGTVWAAVRPGGCARLAKCPEQLQEARAGGSWSVVGAFHTGDDIRALAHTGAGRIWALAGTDLLRSDDGGRDWRTVALAATTQRPVAIAAAAPDDLWLATTTGAGGYALLHSTNGGRTWAVLSTPGVDPLSLAFAGAAHGWLLTVDGRLFATVDGGDTWRLVSGPRTAAG